MRVAERDFQNRVTEALRETVRPSSDFEARLFSSAEDLLSKRRAQRALRSRRRIQWERVFPFLNLAEIMKTLAPHPMVQATIFLVLISSIFWFRPRSEKLRFSDLPDFPKFNNASARYDAMWLAERQADEKEMEDAHLEPKSNDT